VANNRLHPGATGEIFSQSPVFDPTFGEPSQVAGVITRAPSSAKAATVSAPRCPQPPITMAGLVPPDKSETPCPDEDRRAGQRRIKITEPILLPAKPTGQLHQLTP